MLVCQQTRMTMTMANIDPLRDPRWASFVDSCPDALIFHHPDWLRALADVSGQDPIGLAAIGPLGELQGILPLLPTRGLPFGTDSPRTAARLSSLPRTPLAGPLADDLDTTRLLLQQAVDYVERNPGYRLEIKTACPSLDGLVEGLTATPWRSTYVLELPDDPVKIRFGNARNHGHLRSAVRRAGRLGVQVRPAESLDDLVAWYQLYLETMRWHMVPPQPFRFFVNLWGTLRPLGFMTLLLAEQVVEGRRRLLAGSVNLMFGQTVFFLYNGRRREDLSMHPNDILHWRAIHDACEAGYRYYDLGEVPPHQAGLARFKAKWGTTPVQLYRYYYPAASSDCPIDDEDEGRSYQVRRALWRRLPLRATEILGGRAYRYM